MFYVSDFISAEELEEIITSYIYINAEFRKDILWWQFMLPHFHSVSVIKTSPWLGPDTVIATDACLKGCGGTFQNSYFSYKFSQEILDSVHGINKLEALAVTLALKLWGKDLRGLRFMLNCDNLVTVTIINSGRAKDPFLQACAREIAFLACKYEFEVHATHIAGVENRLQDLLG